MSSGVSAVNCPQRVEKRVPLPLDDIGLVLLLSDILGIKRVQLTFIPVIGEEHWVCENSEGLDQDSRERLEEFLRGFVQKAIDSHTKVHTIYEATAILELSPTPQVVVTLWQEAEGHEVIDYNDPESVDQLSELNQEYGSPGPIAWEDMVEKIREMTCDERSTYTYQLDLSTATVQLLALAKVMETREQIHQRDSVFREQLDFVPFVPQPYPQDSSKLPV